MFYKKAMYIVDNIFYKIIHKQMPASIVYEDDVLVAFKDVHPKAKTHILVVPKVNVANYSEFIEYCHQHNMHYLISDFFSTINFIAKNVLKLNYFQLVTNNGALAGQEVMHFHVHIISQDASK